MSQYNKRPSMAYLMQASRLRILIFITCLLTFILVVRLFCLQLLDYKRFETLSFKNHISVNPIVPPRGIIVDRHGVVLADNVPVYSLEVIPERVKHLSEALASLQELIPSITSDDIRLFERLKRQTPSFMPVPLKLKLSQEELATFAVNQYRFPGFSIQVESMRYYPLGPETAHLLGYVGRLTTEDLSRLNLKEYQGAQFLGKTGIERFYETDLHGQNGFEQVETDVNGRVVRVLQKIPAKSGKKLRLTLDSRLQHVAIEALGENNGAVVLMEAKTGGILVMASTPSFDPNPFVKGIPAKTYQQLSNAPERPLFNRAVRGLYPPASTIKPYIALTGLNAAAVDPQTTVYDPGFYKLPNVSHVYHDWNKRGHGVVNLRRAITVSCDPYFYHLGHLLGIRKMSLMLSQFGFGTLTHVDLIEESAGIVPTADWKRRTKGAAWYPGDNLITAIGQGFMLVSPLQMASAVSTLSQKGDRIRPHLLHGFSASDDPKEQLYQPLHEKTVALENDVYWEWVHDAMHAVTTSPEGTGYRFGRNPPYSVAAKTGTAQVFGGKSYTSRLHQVLPKALRDHSLFIAFSPVEDPEVAIAVIVEHDTLASQVARKVLDAYVKSKEATS